MLDIFALTKKIFPITELLWTIGIFLVLFLRRWSAAIRFASVAPENRFPTRGSVCEIEFSLTVLKINFIVARNYRRYLDDQQRNGRICENELRMNREQSS
ncbi:hypothetical protein CFBP5507_11795 [Agrobacterium salinitolerans]|uniref:Uncharacterized protein n=1 Tax=Agrobacterium salinitolerans TaxID=1183413 RepID=A0A9X9P8T7_9HYPH|nr:hypothetical protein [Agrobacterium salinitolerans]UYZ06911.1 hypothetical protein CFBP5507_11795 [Agrobacterium salinitolerans]